MIFFPQDKARLASDTAQTQEVNRHRQEKRCLVRQETTPAQMDFVGAAQVARLDRSRAEKGQEPKQTQLWLISSRDCSKLSAAQFLAARRAEWGIENGLHYVLDVSGTEDLHLRVRNQNSLQALTLLNRLSVCLWRRTRSQPDLSYRHWSEHNRARCHWLLNLLGSPPAKVKW